MRNIGYTTHHGRPMGATTINKIYNFGGHTNKPVKKPTH